MPCSAGTCAGTGHDSSAEPGSRGSSGNGCIVWGRGLDRRDSAACRNIEQSYKFKTMLMVMMMFSMNI